jgi:hypothetical protein
MFMYAYVTSLFFTCMSHWCYVVVAEWLLLLILGGLSSQIILRPTVSAILSWCQAPISDQRPIFSFFL